MSQVVTTLGLSEKGQLRLQRLKEEGYFAEMADGYRFAIALALAHGKIGSESGSGKRTTIFNVGTLDPDGSIALAVSTLREPTDEAVYKTAERLAEWGIEELAKQADSGGGIKFAALLEEAESLLDA